MTTHASGKQQRATRPSNEHPATTGNSTRHQPGPTKQQGAPARHDADSSTPQDKRQAETTQHHTRGQDTTKGHNRGPGNSNRRQQHGARTQPSTSMPHSTGQNAKHTTDSSTTRQHTTQRTTTSRGGQHNQHTPEKKNKQNRAQQPGGREGRTTPHRTPQRRATPHQRDQHNTHQRKAKQHDKRHNTRPEDKAQKQGARGSAGKRSAASTGPADMRNTKGNNTRGTGTTREHRTTERKHKPAPAGKQHPQHHKAAHPTAQDTGTSPSTATPAHQRKKKKEEAKKRETNRKQEQGEQKKTKCGGRREKGEKKNQKTRRRRGGRAGGQQDTKAQGIPGRKARNAGDNRGAHRKKKAKKGGVCSRKIRRQGPRHSGTENTERERQQGRTKGKRKKKENTATTTNRATPARRGPSKQRAHQDWPQKNVRRTKTCPGGRPAQPGQQGRAQANTHGTWAWRPPTQKWRCRRPHETAPVHWPIPLSKDGRYRKPDVSVTGSTHANHRSTRSPRPTPEGPARDNPMAGPRTGTTRREPTAAASAAATGRHKEPGSQSASTCPAQTPSNSGGASPRGEERHHSVWKADQSTECDRTGRGAV